MGSYEVFAPFVGRSRRGASAFTIGAPSKRHYCGLSTGHVIPRGPKDASCCVLASLRLEDHLTKLRALLHSRWPQWRCVTSPPQAVAL
jgi:hypothetical protein